MRDHILFYLNGKRKTIGPHSSSQGYSSRLSAFTLLSDYLRYEATLTGTKVVCAEGDCGACTVLKLFRFSGSEEAPQYVPINSCVTPVAQLDGSSLITVEGLTLLNPPPHFDPIQKAMMTCHGSQCGFCTPGFVMALKGLVEKRISSPQSAPPPSPFSPGD